jgi:Ice-binding-like
MSDIGIRGARRSKARYWLAGGFALVATAAVLVATQSAGASDATVGLGNASSFAVLAGSTVTNTTDLALPDTVINGDLGVSPLGAVTGFPPGIINGTEHQADGVAAGAQADLTTAYNDAAGRAPTAGVGATIGAGQTLLSGVYKADTSLQVNGTLTLDAQNDPAAVFIFQVPTTLTTGSAATISLVNGANACNVFWQVGTSATLGTGTAFQGTILALASITVTTSVTIVGRALARNAAVTLDHDTITNAGCAVVPVAVPTVPGPGPSATATRSTPAPSPARTPRRRPTPAPSPGPTPPGLSPAPAPSPGRGTIAVTG